MAKFVYTLIVCCLLVGCSSNIEYRGKLPESEQLAKIKVGQHREEDVISLIGSPTNTSLYGPKKWYYIHKKTEKTSFFEEKVLEEKMIIVSFNDNGIVNDVVEVTPDGKVIDPIRHKTPTLGEDRPILQQIFSNFGRFAKRAEKK